MHIGVFILLLLSGERNFGRYSTDSYISTMSTNIQGENQSDTVIYLCISVYPIHCMQYI